MLNTAFLVKFGSEYFNISNVQRVKALASSDGKSFGDAVGRQAANTTTAAASIARKAVVVLKTVSTGSVGDKIVIKKGFLWLAKLKSVMKYPLIF
ncbi:hypothetical protein FFJ24_010160 [Pedobacter sp. KBS0701]|uniref:hypothetical protein n=1 Tax=Pedobacter sp. KBS0701 TaxID=2578106 RepID=UPI00110EEE6E|nr:hypothetical protein [Pedobacter sp. KBS0701]QDW25154.1 hypothetical protein FFJ24_010160 [Pedobacter sp. KBS0701]